MPCGERTMVRKTKQSDIYDELNRILTYDLQDRGFTTEGFPEPIDVLVESSNGQRVSRSCLKRLEAGTPLNPVEADSFRFLEKNPQVVDRFFELANEVRECGFTQYGARTILEMLRWESEITETIRLDEADGVYALNDRCTSTLARLYNEAMLPAPPLFEIRSKGRAGEDW